MSKLLSLLKQNIPLLILVGISVLLFAVNVRITLFSYNNFDFGKFDLGNMTQMVWNTLHGRFMYLTDYFGANVPRWSMSHVDPIILLVIPFFVIWQSPVTLILFQLILVIFSSLLIYAISYEVTKSKVISMLFGLTYLLYPAVGFITARTAYHGVSLAIPFFLASFLVFEKMYNSNNFSLKRLILFSLLVFVALMGKEQIALYFVMFGVFIILFRNYHNIKSLPSKIGLTLTVISISWFVTAFFIIIPSTAHFRSEGYEKFSVKLGINPDTARNVALDNYFLSRYSEFGDSYTQVALGILTHPDLVVKIALSGDKLENFRQTFEPLGYTPFLYPQLFVLAVPDLLINYLTGAEAGGISEIYNHRISMIVPVLLLSTIYFYKDLMLLLSTRLKGKTLSVIKYLIPTFFVLSTLYTTMKYQNPVYMWLNQAVGRRLPVFTAEAKTDASVMKKTNINLGDKVRVSSLDSKDRECAKKVIEIIPQGVSVSGPDYLGSHLSMRETYAIFPALYNETDYVIVDVFARKIFTILGINNSMLKEIIQNILRDPNYKFVMGCGNLFVYKHQPDTNKQQLLPIQERLEYTEKVSYTIQDGVTLVDYSVPKVFHKGQSIQTKFVYAKKASANLDGYIFFITVVNRKNGEVYQMANLPSFGLLEPDDWEKGKYYIENVDFILPDFVDTGDAMLFLGATNTVKSQSIYLGDIEVQ